MATPGATGQHHRALAKTSHPGVYRRGSRWVVVYREDGRQRKQSASTFREAREIKIRRTAEEASRRAGRTLHSYALEWVDHYAGRGAHGVINDRTRREYRRLLIAYALAYFAPEERLRDLDERRVRGFATGFVASTDATGTGCVTARCTTPCCRCALVCATRTVPGWPSAMSAPPSCCRAAGAGAPMSSMSGAS